jgi:glycerol-3-phosphate acyltransferase PlsY
MITLVAAVLASYLLGSIPFSHLITRWTAGIDLRRFGSGNLGASNTFRAVGWKGGVAVLLLDVGKGFTAAFFFSRLAGPAVGPEAGTLLCGVAAVLGHLFSPFMRFRGGKGIATTAGAYLALAPLPLAVAAAVFVAGLGLTRIVSVGSMAGAVVLPVAVWALGAWRDGFRPLVFWLSVALSLVILVKHRSNVKRILDGTESRAFRNPPEGRSTR